MLEEFVFIFNYRKKSKNNKINRFIQEKKNYIFKICSLRQFELVSVCLVVI